MMDQFEKVIKALQLTKSNPVEGWDYRGEGFDGAMVHTSTALIDAALALIRQQQERIAELEAARTARVMTLEEANEADAVWIEVLGNVRIIPARINVLDGVAIVFKFIATQEKASLESYGAEWRAWTSRPTDEQRAATPWPEPPKEG